MFKSIIGVTLLSASALFVVPSAAEADGPQKSGRYSIDATHSSVIFCIRHFDVSRFYGRFNELSGSLLVDADDPDGGMISLTIPAASIDTNSKDRDDHLKGPDFFNVKEFPDVEFESTRIERADSKDRFKVTGKLSLHGVTKEIVISVLHTGEGETRAGYRTGFETTFVIKRSDYGMTYGLPDALGDEVEITIAIEATAK